MKKLSILVAVFVALVGVQHAKATLAQACSSSPLKTTLCVGLVASGLKKLQHF